MRGGRRPSGPERGVDHLVLAHAGNAAKRFGDDGRGEMVVVAGEVFDRDDGIRESGFDQGFNFTGRHSHFLRSFRRTRREEPLMGIAQLRQRYGNAVRQCQFLIRHGGSDFMRGNAGGLRRAEQGRGILHRQHVAGLVFAEPEFCAGLRRSEGDAGIPGERHFRDRDEQAAVGEVVAGADVAGGDLGAHEIAVAHARPANPRRAGHRSPTPGFRAARGSGRVRLWWRR